MRVEKTSDEKPICSFCERELDFVKARKEKKKFLDMPSIATIVCFFCPHCRKVLGVGQSAWMP